MTGFGRFKGHRHKSFEESLREAASPFVLRRLAEVWAEEPPLRVYGASEFAPNHAAYAEAMEEKYRAFPSIARPGWLAKKLEADPRGLDGAAAVALLDGFRRDPTLWRDRLSLNRWDRRRRLLRLPRVVDDLPSRMRFRRSGADPRAENVPTRSRGFPRRPQPRGGWIATPTHPQALRPKYSNVIHPQVPEKSRCGESA